MEVGWRAGENISLATSCREVQVTVHSDFLVVVAIVCLVSWYFPLSTQG